MRICVLGLRGFPFVEGGVEKHCERLYPKMSDSFVVIRRKPYVTKKTKESSQYDNIRFVDLPSTRIRGFETVIHSFLATRRAIKEKPDAVHIHNIGPGFFTGYLRKKRIPVVITYHSPNYEHNKWGWFTKKLLRYSEKVALKNASRIIFVNRFQMERFSAEIQKKSEYIPNGIEKPILSSTTSYLNEIGVEARKYVLAVGRITPEKGFDTLIKAFEASKHAGYKLVIAGGVEFENNYKEELGRLAGEDVIFTGYVYGDKLNQLYTNAALFVLSSNNEGFPLVLLEAMSFGLDIIASDIPACHLIELNKDDYFETGNYQKLAKKISERIANPKERCYELGDFNWDSVAKKTEAVFKKAVVDESFNGE